EELIWLIALSIITAILLVYHRTRDPLHPMIFIGPMMLYIYALVPFSVYKSGELLDLFPDAAALESALLFTLLSVTLFAAGCLRPRVSSRGPKQGGGSLTLSPLIRKRLAIVGSILGSIGLGVFLYRLALSGGLTQVYSRPKGGAASLVSGYFTVAPLLTIPATFLLFLSRHGQRPKASFVFLILALLSPHWVQGLLGGSRGPTFLAMGSLFLGWFIIGSRRPPLRAVLVVLVGTGILMMFLKAHRQELYVGAEEPVEFKGWREMLVPARGVKDHASIFSLGGIVAARHHGYCLWGKGIAVQLFVRAIPRQIWPNKYEDVGMSWMVTRPGSLGLSSPQWRQALGWEPNAGSAAGFVLSAFLEFGWGGLVLAYLLGWGYGALWRRSIMFGGIWSILYAEAFIVSVYLTTQGLISAWGYRFLYLAVPTVILWRVTVLPGGRDMPTPSIHPSVPEGNRA
ncbi:MAG: hypothetical protein KJ726_09725, partial [Verrucomicrobia bacterium]|nr:hypothetical protein [Verrucomicrobiota bacterium]